MASEKINLNAEGDSRPVVQGSSQDLGKEDASTNSRPYDAVVVGAGAAGLMVAALVGAKGKSVLLIEKTKKIGAKILISGGGRCNFTNMDAAPDNYLSTNPHFMKSAMKRYTPWDFIGLVSAHGLTYTEKKLGQLFCDQGSKAIVKMLERECELAAVEICLNCEVENLQTITATADQTNSSYHLTLTGGDRVQTDHLVMATGGLSIPKMGASGFSYDVARQFGLDVTALSPALVPFTFGATDLDFMKALAGVALDCELTTGGVTFRENLLFTHRGLSGPATLQASSYWREKQPIYINLLPDMTAKDLYDALVQARADTPGQMLSTVLGAHFPARFAKAFAEAFCANKPMSQHSNKELSAVTDTLHQWTITPIGTEGYRTAEVTKGGVNPAQLSSRTMEAIDHKGLYFIGECVDVTGWLGGYNFQWAWASAAAAAEAIARGLNPDRASKS